MMNHHQVAVHALQFFFVSLDLYLALRLTWSRLRCLLVVHDVLLEFPLQGITIKTNARNGWAGHEVRHSGSKYAKLFRAYELSAKKRPAVSIDSFHLRARPDLCSHCPCRVSQDAVDCSGSGEATKESADAVRCKSG